VYSNSQRSSAAAIAESSSPADQSSRLAASLAHEINNPLDSVLNILYLVKAEALTDKGRQYLALAEEEVRRVSQIAHDAMDSFRDRTARKDTDVPELLGAVVDLYRPRLESRGISVNTRYRSHGDHLPIYSGPMRQAFSNLLLNAAAAMPQGGRLFARTSNSQEWSGRQRHGLRVTFADNGSGITTENLHKIFEPFFTTKGSNGNGLGLSLAKDVVQKHGGSLRVRSCTRSGRTGSVFTIFLPDA
jgi:two-component system, chemotaxis family, CheB/CheR fusion protein